MARHLLFLLAAISVAGDGFLSNSFHTAEDLFTPLPACIVATGAAASLGSLHLEAKHGYPGFLHGDLFRTADRIDDFLFGIPLPATAAATWLTGSLIDHPEMEATGEQLCRGLLLTYGVVGTAKFVTNRTRPDGSDSRSFPSGHAAGAACSAVVLWDRSGPWAGIPFAVVAAYTCLSRVNLGRHFPSDTIMGAAIGAACGIASGMTAGESSDAEKKIYLRLSIDTQGGISGALW